MMGVEDLDGMSTPQNKGGRPKGSTTRDEGGKREVDGDPYTKDDGDEYWENVWEMHEPLDGEIRSHIMNVASYTNCLSRTVVDNVHNRGVYRFDDLAEDPPEWFERHLETLRLEGINTLWAPSPDSDSNTEPSSGLSQLISEEEEQIEEALEEEDDDEPSSGLSSLL